MVSSFSIAQRSAVIVKPSTASGCITTPKDVFVDVSDSRPSSTDLALLYLWTVWSQSSAPIYL